MVHHRSLRTVLLIALTLMTFVGSPVTQALAAPAADVVGTTYTSPQFGYTVTWPANWYVAEESSDVFDRLVITDVLSFMIVSGNRGFAGNALTALTLVSVIKSTSEGVSNWAPMLDGNGNEIKGGDATRAFAAYTLTIPFSDGTSGNVAEYIEARTVVPGESVVVFDAVALLDFYDGEKAQIDQILASFAIPAPPEPELLAGEPGPVFVDGQWRVAVAAAALNESFPNIGLKAKSGKEWLVLVADVTNWSDDDGTFAAKEFTIRVADSNSPKKIAAGSTKTVAKSLALSPQTSDLKVAIESGETERVALAFQLPAGSEDLALVGEDQALPLTDTLEIRLDPDELPDLAGPPKVSKGEIASASDGETLRVQLANKDKADKILLLGVDAPDKGDCFAAEAKANLVDLEGQAVLLEKDDSVTGGSGTVRYVWLVNRDGTRSLLNQQVIAGGFAELGSIPEEARFAAWLAGGSATAETKAAGLWTACVATPTAAATSKPSATATAQATQSSLRPVSPVPSVIGSSFVSPTATP